MKKKIFSAMLLFACSAATTGTFVSCTDYDDDISEIRSDIDKLKSADELLAKISDMNSAIETAKSELQAAIKAAEADATNAATKAAEDKVAALQAELNKTVEEANATAAAAQKTADETKAALDGLTDKDGAVTKAQAAADAAQAAAEAAQKAADEANKALKGENGVVSQLNAITAENKQQESSLNALTSKIKTIETKLGIGDATGEGVDLTELNNKINDLDKKLKDIIGEYSTMVTSVSLYYDATQHEVQAGVQGLKFSLVTEKTNTFGAETDKPLTFKEGETKTYEAKLVIRVNPTTADLKSKAARIHLINSQGIELDEYVTCTKVEPYAELITAPTTRSTGANNGLWTVTFKLKDGFDPDGFKAAVQTKVDDQDRDVLFAVAVKNTTENNDDRRVISAYGVAVGAETYAPADNDFIVSNMEGQYVNIKDIHNRYTNTENGTSTTDVEELSWLDDGKPGTSAILNGESKNADNRIDDNRTDKDLLSAEVGKAINIKVAWDEKNGKPAKNIRGFYVTLDKKFALESAPSEWNAWQSYEYENVGKDGVKAHMFEGNEGRIMIKSNQTINDIIGFRVYAVNLDGTLLDPDGRAFYVVLGNAATEGVISAVDIMADKKSNSTTVAEGLIPTGELYQKINGVITKVTSINALKWEVSESNAKYGSNGATTAENVSPAFGVNFLDATGNATTDAEKVVSAKLAMTDIAKYVDGETYSQTCKLYDKDGVLLKTLTATAKKVMPTECKALTWWDNVSTGKNAYSPLLYNKDAKDKNSYFKLPSNMNVDSNGKITGAAAKATFSINQIFKGLDADKFYTFSFANSAYDAEKQENIAKDADYSNNIYSLTIDPKYIDGNARTMDVAYVYKGISTKFDATTKKWVVAGDHKVSGTSYTATYRCWSSTMTYKMSKNYTGTATWTSKQQGSGSVDLSKVLVENTAADCQNITGNLNAMIGVYLLIDASSIKTNINQYTAAYSNGKITLKQIQNTQLANKEVTVNLTFDVIDLFGHRMEISVPVVYTAVADEN